MAKFRFKLDAVLSHRRILEEQAQRDLSEVLLQRVRLLDALRGQQQTIQESKHSLGEGLRGRVDLDSIGRFAVYAGQVRIRAQQLVQELAGVEKQIEARRQQLLAATKARKALELLRDRQLAQWRQAADQREAAALDEFAAQSFIRRQDLAEESS
ncbi:MAG: flagellar export protein FliJ [Planctomycetota bacterium]|nr:flagellar export protein FliJ [Planctomycetota bacterium]